jgi:hypothetical protein
MTKKELIQAIEQLEQIARDNKDLAERSVAQAKEWKALYEGSSTEENTLNVSSKVH